MRIITINTNGIRSAAKKGFLDWLEKTDADFVCIQELKAKEADMAKEGISFGGYHAFYNYADKPGYSGCALLCKDKPESVEVGFGSKEFDIEGRYVQVQHKNLVVISTYFPSGSSSELRQEAKFRFLDEIAPKLAKLRESGLDVVVCGDVNIAHKEIDIKNWKGNLKNSGFLPEERQWLTTLFDENGWVDVFRKLDPRPEQYTWWSNRGQARAKNVGWRIDYQIATPQLAQAASQAQIYTEQRFSDHAPLIIDYEYEPLK